MTDEYVSYVPNGNGRFIRYAHAQPSSPTNRLVELGRFLYNLTRALFQLLNLLNSVITTLNNTMSSLPFVIRYIVHAILAICFPFYSIYQGYMALINRIHQITYPIYRAMTLITRLFTYFVKLPLRIITFCVTETQTLLRNVLISIIFLAIIIGLILVLSNDNQSNYMQLYLRNVTEFVLKKSSMI